MNIHVFDDRVVLSPPNNHSLSTKAKEEYLRQAFEENPIHTLRFIVCMGPDHCFICNANTFTNKTE